LHVFALTLLLLAAPPPLEPRSDEEKSLYLLGLLAARSVQDFDLTPKESELVRRGFADALEGRPPLVDPSAYEQQVQRFAHQRLQAAAERAKTRSRALEESAAKEPGAFKTFSGLVYQSLREGSGASPRGADDVRVHYVGRLPSGAVFDTTYRRGEPAQITLNNVIPCWTEALQLMKVGGKARIVCPARIAYGDSGRPPVIRGGVSLAFEVELLEVVKK